MTAAQGERLARPRLEVGLQVLRELQVRHLDRTPGAGRGDKVEAVATRRHATAVHGELVEDGGAASPDAGGARMKPGACDEDRAGSTGANFDAAKAVRECAADHRLDATFDRQCGGAAGDLDILQRDVLGLARDLHAVQRHAAQVDIRRRARPGGRAWPEHAQPDQARAAACEVHTCAAGQPHFQSGAGAVSDHGQGVEHDGITEHIRRCAGRHVDQGGPTLRRGDGRRKSGVVVGDAIAQRAEVAHVDAPQRDARRAPGPWSHRSA